MGSKLPIVSIMARELVTRERSPRVPEPALVMDDEAQVAAYTAAGREAGVMAPVYLHHCAQVCDVIRPGDFVVDLACGPATQLAMVARLNPEVQFLGVDLSEEMLDRATEHIGAQGISNVKFRHGNIADLAFLDDASVDAFMSTMALHHLPTYELLERTLAEVARALKHGGGLYLVDFGHLRAERSISDFANQYADRQPELFTIDYLNSLKAAFWKDEFVQAARPLQQTAEVKSTFLVPYMVAVKSAPRRQRDPRVAAALRELLAALPTFHKTDYADLKTFFRAGGLRGVHTP